MVNIFRIKILIVFVWLFSLNAFAQSIQSPDGRLSLSFAMTADGEPTYQLSFEGRPVLQKSKLGIELKDQPAFIKGFTIVKADTSQADETSEPVWGEVKQIRNHYKELTVTLQQAAHNNRRMILKFRLFNDGLGFRYEVPEQAFLKYFIVSEERTEFNQTGDHRTFWIPGDYDTNEYSYSTTKLSEIDATRGRAAQEIAFRLPIAANAVQTPLMMKTADGLYINIHEAALINYPAMNLMVNRQTFSLSAHLVPDAVGNKAYLQAPYKTPWRTIVVSDKATDILASKLILNLNESSRIRDLSWIKPLKYVGIWWGMHVGTTSWNYADVGNIADHAP
jgi:glucan 1,4-alpha-glucosidase